MSKILEVSGLCKDYNNFHLKNLNFSLEEGCITGFMGKNGAGKTTTIKSILNVIKYNSGEIKFFGKSINRNEKEIKDRLGIVFDNGHFYEELTIAEMKSIIAPAYSRWCEEDFNRYMKEFHLNPKQEISTLSKGMKMKFSLALALSHRAELLIMDEPTSGLDPVVRKQVLEILKDYMRKDGRGVFFSTHITSDLDKVADMLILINKGEIIMQEEKDMLLDSHNLVKGNPKDLNDNNRKLFVNLDVTDYGFTGITKYGAKIRNEMENVIIERPTIEDVMLAYIERS